MTTQTPVVGAVGDYANVACALSADNCLEAAYRAAIGLALGFALPDKPRPSPRRIADDLATVL